MAIFYDQSNEPFVTINGKRIKKEVFSILEPSYNGTNRSVTRIKYDSEKKLLERWYISGTYYKTEGIWKPGEHYISRLALYLRATENSVEADTDLARRVSEIQSFQSGANPDYTTLRKASYPKIDELVVALWEKIVEGRDDKSVELQKKRDKIKKEYPKPVPVVEKVTKKKASKKK